MPDHLFIYGTLHPTRAPGEIADVVQRMTSEGRGTIRGRLYDLGEYPGVVLDDTTKERVPGEVFTLPSESNALARLDDYEEYHPQHPESSLFRRIETTVTLQNGGQRVCWVYVYNRPLAHKPA
jgi:gamma-glutamylcyclotransferase (GGCT)/AIG2-like uncharacterized protein YtfP